MALQTPTPNAYNNNPPVLFTTDNYKDPFTVKAQVEEFGGLPKEAFDQIETDIEKLVRNDFLGFIDYFNLNIGFETDNVMFVETTTPDYVIDDDGAVTRDGNDFTIDFSAVEGYEEGENAFVYQKDMVITVYDDTGKEEQGVITEIDPANNKFTARTYDGADWTVATSNLTLSLEGSDFDKSSCSPEAPLEYRKTKTKSQRFQKVKTSLKATKGEKYKFCYEDGTWAWYDDNRIKAQKKHNDNIKKTLLKQHPAVENSGAFGVGKYGSLGLIPNLKENGLVYSGYVQTVADLDTILDYYEDDLALTTKEFSWHMDTTQMKYADAIARELNAMYNIQRNVDCMGLCNLGFQQIQYRGFTIHFTKWSLTGGNSPYSKKRVVMPKSILMPMGTIPTKINGEDRNVPYIFKAYRNDEWMPGMTRTIIDGAAVNNGTCEFKRITLSSDVALIVPVPEAIMISI